MTLEQLKQWYALQIQTVNGYHMSDKDWQELTRLNHLVMQAANNIHNTNMLNKETQQ